MFKQLTTRNALQINNEEFCYIKETFDIPESLKRLAYRYYRLWNKKLMQRKQKYYNAKTGCGLILTTTFKIWLSTEKKFI